MANAYSMDDLLEFLSHAGERGLMPAATAQALAVAVRNVFSVLGGEERADIRSLDLDTAIKRFNNKRAKDFNPSSLKEYARRVRRAMELYGQWRENPANFSVRTRTPSAAKKDRAAQPEIPTPKEMDYQSGQNASAGYQSAFPVRPGRVVTLLNIPEDLTTAEAERLAQFVRMLAVQ
jgi:hypothetical protein